jgi:hypothetical protein
VSFSFTFTLLSSHYCPILYSEYWKKWNQSIAENEKRISSSQTHFESRALNHNLISLFFSSSFIPFFFKHSKNLCIFDSHSHDLFTNFLNEIVCLFFLLNNHHVRLVVRRHLWWTSNIKNEDIHFRVCENWNDFKLFFILVVDWI